MHMHTLKIAIVEPTEQPFDLDHLTAEILARLEQLPPFRRRVLPPPLRLNHPLWLTDRRVELARPRVPPRGARPGRDEGAGGADRPRVRDSARPLPPAVGDARVPAVRRRPGGRGHEDAPCAGGRGGGQRAARQPRRRSRGRRTPGEGSAADRPPARADADPAPAGADGPARRDHADRQPARPPDPHGAGRRSLVAAPARLGGDGAAADARRAAGAVQRRAHRTPQLRDVHPARGRDQGGPAGPRRHDERRGARGRQRRTAPLAAGARESCPTGPWWPAYPWRPTSPAPRRGSAATGSRTCSPRWPPTSRTRASGCSASPGRPGSPRSSSARWGRTCSWTGCSSRRRLRSARRCGSTRARGPRPGTHRPSTWWCPTSGVPVRRSRSPARRCATCSASGRSSRGSA